MSTITKQNPGIHDTSQFYAEQQPTISPEVDVITSPPLLPIPANYEYGVEPYAAERKRSRWPWIIGGVVFIIIVVAAVVGGVLGSRAKSNNNNNNNSNSNSSSSSSNSGGSGSSSVDGSSSGGGSSVKATMTGTATAMEETDYAYPLPLASPFAIFAIRQSDNGMSSKAASSSSSSSSSPGTSSFSSSKWTSLGGVISSTYSQIAGLSSLSSTDNSELFTIGTDSDVWSRDASNSANSNDSWVALGGDVLSSPAVASWSADRWDLFVIGLNGGIYQKYNTSAGVATGWYELKNMGTKFLGAPSPTAVSWGAGHIAVLAVDKTGKLQVNAWDRSNGSIWEAKDLDGDCTSRPVAASPQSQRIDVLVRGGDGGLWHRSNRAGDWRPWRSVSGASVKILAEPEVVSWGKDRLDAFAWAEKDRSLLHWSYDGAKDAWSEVEEMGGELSGPPKAVVHKEESLSVFALERMGGVVWRTWTKEGGWWPKEEFEDLGPPV